MPFLLRTRALPGALAALALAACQAPPAPGPQPQPITGHYAWRYLLSPDGAPTPMNLHTAFFSALTDDGHGGWIEHPGTSGSDGRFTIPGEFSGHYWLRTYDGEYGANQYLWTDRTALDFDQVVPGRAGVQSASPGTTITFDEVGGLAPWTANDGFAAVSGSLGFYYPSAAPMEEGSTVLDGTMPWRAFPLPSPAARDDLFFVQTRHFVDGPTTLGYGAMARTFRLGSQAIVDGKDTRLTGSFEPARDFTYHLHWKRSAFAALGKSVHPTLAGSAAVGHFDCGAMLGGTQEGLLMDPPVVLQLDPEWMNGTTDMDYDLTIANPFPPEWLVHRFMIGYPVTLPVPGAPELPSPTLVGAISVFTTEMGTEAKPTVPLVTPPQAPTIAGRSLFQEQEHVGATPTVAWQKPETGTPTSYLLFLLHWTNFVSGNPSLEQSSVLVVPGDVTSVRLPPGLLKADEHYVLNIQAVSQPGEDVRAHGPFRQALPYGSADLVSSSFSP